MLKTKVFIRTTIHTRIKVIKFIYTTDTIFFDKTTDTINTLVDLFD